MSVLGAFKLPALVNEPFTAVDDLIQRDAQEIFPNVNGKDVSTGELAYQLSPYDKRKHLAKYHLTSVDVVERAIQGALEAKKKWSQTPLHERAAIFYRAANLLATKYRSEMMATTMVGQGKNLYQADIDCVAESIDFLKTFATLAEQLYQSQPPFNVPNVWNRSEQRPIDGFVYAISPFTFTALAVNLVLAPIIVGNVVIWKPSPGAILSNWLFNKIMIEAGLPAGVLQFLPGDAELVMETVLSSKEFSALHFTGSTQVFRTLWTKIGTNVGHWRSYPRLIGETSGKNFHLLHPSADVRNAALKTVRAVFEYQGQKCSACSRVYVPSSLAEEFLSILKTETSKLTMGSKITDFCGPVINEAAYERISKFLSDAKLDDEVDVIEGGECDDSVGYYIRPTILCTTNPLSKFMTSEIFGPVVTVYTYQDSEFGASLFELIDTTSEFALSGALFSSDRQAIVDATEGLRFSAGNFYINDQCTGAMPGHQPFGGSRASGTNDKAGYLTLLQRFVSPRTIKENFGTIDEVFYPSNKE